MNAAVSAWWALRILRWASWLGAIAFAVYFQTTREQHINQFGQLLPLSEFLMFTLLMAPPVIGVFEMMMRDRAGIPRPPPR